MLEVSIIHVKDAVDRQFATLLTNDFIIGEEDDPAMDTMNNIANNMDTCSRPLIGCKVPKVVLKGLEFGIFYLKVKRAAYKEAAINLNSAQLPCLPKKGTYQYLLF
ncbi:hypothetical protein C2G38_2137977 [Gigaspora rosea]|uniref:Uncharacterized protein n=1 Tax=Gigaspora rosea TaxID=44941 RepID=A0A397W0K2_9GLOM|nr:hypothetical protein C2G38_2137977 [Gigaspora rosea]